MKIRKHRQLGHWGLITYLDNDYLGGENILSPDNQSVKSRVIIDNGIEGKTGDGVDVIQYDESKLDEALAQLISIINHTKAIVDRMQELINLYQTDQEEAYIILKIMNSYKKTSIKLLKLDQMLIQIITIYNSTELKNQKLIERLPEQELWTRKSQTESSNFQLAIAKPFHRLNQIIEPLQISPSTLLYKNGIQHEDWLICLMNIMNL